MKCEHCGATLRREHGLWVDLSGNQLAWVCAENDSNGGDAAPHHPVATDDSV